MNSSLEEKRENKLTRTKSLQSSLTKNEETALQNCFQLNFILSLTRYMFPNTFLEAKQLYYEYSVGEI